MAQRTEFPVAEATPPVHTDDPVSTLVEVDQTRRASRLLGRTFGTIGFFGIIDFVAALLRDTVSPSRFFSLDLAIFFAIIGVLAWRESRQPVINGEIVRPGAPTDEMPPDSPGGA